MAPTGDARPAASDPRTGAAPYSRRLRLPWLTGEEAGPSPARVTFLADHVEFGITVLHIHHQGEDELLYPKLIERVPGQAPVTEQVEQEHEAIKTALDAASDACSAWRQAPSADTREALAAALDHVNAVVLPHLDDEENKVVPLAAVTLTQQEWDALGKHGASQFPPNKRAIAFGMLLDPLDEADRAHIRRRCQPSSGPSIRS